MAKHVFSLLLKIALFAVVMLTVAKIVPYDELVHSVTRLFDFQSVDKFTHFILGEPDPEARESLNAYLSILINTLISVPVMSFITIAYSAMTRKMSLTDVSIDWIKSIWRRLIKIFGFTFLFWALFRLLPYQAIFPKETYSTFTLVVIMGFQLILTIVCYWIITRKITTKRSL